MALGAYTAAAWAAWVDRSGLGLPSEVAAEAMGVDTTREKVRAVVLAAFFAGAAGALFAHLELYVNPKSFTFMRSIELVAMVVLGGLGSISGSVVAAILLTVLPEALRPVQDYTGYDLRLVLYGLLLMVLPMTRPSGLFGSREVFERAPTRGGTLRAEGGPG
jgi:branched-chain amino acid transport system permease protein